MSTNEPAWPTIEKVQEACRKWLADAGQVQKAIDMCRAAWLAANDDPASSPVGEVRQLSVDDGNVATRWPKGWLVGHPGMENGDFAWYMASFVKGWPVIGAVPGTPAAEAQS